MARAKEKRKGKKLTTGPHHEGAGGYENPRWVLLGAGIELGNSCCRRRRGWHRRQTQPPTELSLAEFSEAGAGSLKGGVRFLVYEGIGVWRHDCSVLMVG